MRGIERRIEAGLDPSVPSVASLFVSRWDVAVGSEVPASFATGWDRRRQADLSRVSRAARLRALAAPSERGRTAAADALGQHGTKDPDASDVLYVEALAAPLTIDTMPEKTLLAFADHGEVGEALAADGGDADEVLAQFEAAAVDIAGLAARLQREGAEAFAASWREMLDSVTAKREQLAA